MDKIKEFQTYLYDWYKKSARDLPWRNTDDPYRIWISEIMLQQTRVDTVIPYYNKFIDKIPTVEDLASIEEDLLLKLWQGLGYYTRAINLKRAALIIVKEYNGIIPSSKEALVSLPGIGSYTAGAMLSIAFSQRVQAVDGNVLRILARVYGIREDIKEPAIKKMLTNIAEGLIPAENPGDFNQALMDLGATICLPAGEPKCSECPVRNLCAADQNDLTRNIPLKIRKKNREIEKRTVLILSKENLFAIRKRKPGNLLPNLWEFLNFEGHLTEEESHQIIKNLGLTVLDMQPILKSKHIFTHLEWHMIGFFITVSEPKECAGLMWASRDELKHQYSIPTAFKDYLKYILSLSLGYEN